MKADDLLRDPEFRDLTAKGYTCRQIHKRCKHAAKFSDTTVYRRWCILRAEFGMPHATTSYRPSIDESATAPPLPEEPPQEPTPQEYLAIETERMRANRKRRDESQALKAALERIEQLEEQAEALDAMTERSKAPSIPLLKTENGQVEHEATAVMLWSDWHVEEVVSLESVNGMNTYSPEIARDRSFALARNCVKLIKKERKDVRLDSAVIWLGGDFITGYIHDENLVTTAMGPTEAIVFAGSLVSGALRHVLDHGGLKRLIVPCSLGNHGRTTKRMFMVGTGTNHEYAMYRYLEREFASDERVTFMRPVSDYLYADVYDQKIRFHHGHGVAYYGGENGLGVPVAKRVRKWNEWVRASMTAIGHYHTHSMPTSDSWTNGSLIGVNPYSQHIGAPPDPPVQGFRLLDSRYGWTISAPVFVREVV